ncbi:hypothetical protein PC116_g2674 [Phytophthora cactorum]|nr:hypothetical protein Pcac1_g19789 [Phytophthora cactorum]KAG2921816.1 hypothetical protein PC114_g5518 [Phytophthora cactorum]KAG4062164.1 hypothetical protein PC123_g2955 [Phytophthora cactorum]KAG4249558.1 hypothetical protein PC116_g2674 [Phytophthora cactorum]
MCTNRRAQPSSGDMDCLAMLSEVHGSSHKWQKFRFVYYLST